jgi:hypothetical protein
MNERITQEDLEKLKDYDRLRLEYTRLHEDYRRILNKPNMQLPIPIILGQREKLRAFSDYAQKRMWEDGDKDIYEFVEDFLSL